MATVNVRVHIEGKAYKIPTTRQNQVPFFMELEERLLVIAAYIEQAIPENEDVWMVFEKGTADKQNSFQFYSPTVPVKKIIGIFDEFKG